MKRAVRGGSALRRALVLGAAGLLWVGLAPGEATAGRSALPGNAMTWGDNALGQLGDAASPGGSNVPVTVCGTAPCPKPLDNVIEADAGDWHNIALRTDGTVWAWGDNGVGQLGDGTNEGRSAPVRVGSLTDVTAIAAGDNYSLALRSDGTVWAWGDNFQGQLGNGTTTDSNVPVQVCAENTGAGCTRFLTGVTAISAGGAHSLALDAGGGLRAWGFNADGRLGDGTTQQRLVPVPTLLTSGVRTMSAGGSHSLALMADRTVRAWGGNSSGQVGDGTTTNRLEPVRVCAVGTTAGCTTYLSGVASVAAGSEHSLAVLSDGGVRSWGDNFSGQLGNGSARGATDSPVPVRVCATGTIGFCTKYLGGATAVAAGFRHSLSRQSDGTVRAWGENISGQLGNARLPGGGDTTYETNPVQVCAPRQTAPCSRMLDGVGAVAAGFDHSLAIALPRADLSVTTTSDAPVANGESLTYTITVRNDGPAAADNVVLDDSLPGEGRFSSATSTRGSCATVPPTGTSDTVTCALGRIGRGGQATVTLTVTVRAVPGTVITNRATVTSGNPDPDPGNNTATLGTTVS
ncbi:hypothetical protein ACIRSU_25305 [Streptomyces sp. NPDC101160]|uniref:RCC1 domain-containing protein n=1 Tax=Streptomyces sp. NPDC101160 TaxID=3366118 RepID=UPI0037F24AC0